MKRRRPGKVGKKVKVLILSEGRPWRHTDTHTSVMFFLTKGLGAYNRRAGVVGNCFSETIGLVYNPPIGVSRLSGTAHHTR